MATCNTPGYTEFIRLFSISGTQQLQTKRTGGKNIRSLQVLNILREILQILLNYISHSLYLEWKIVSVMQCYIQVTTIKTGDGHG